MKAVKITSIGQAELLDVPMPEVKPGYVLLKVNSVGFCGSDLNTFNGKNPLVKLPVIPGHEIAATIFKIGEDVPADLKEGMKVTVNPYSNCGRCSACVNFRPNACQFNETLGVQRNGGMSEFLLLPYDKVIPGDDFSEQELALVEPMSVGFHAVDRAVVSDTDIVVVIGCGMIGVGAIVRAANRGAKVIAVDVSDAKLELAKSLGAFETVNSSRENLEKRILELTQEKGADVVIEAVGRKETYIASIEIASFTARVVFIGYAKEPIPFDTQFFVKKELDIKGSRNALPKDFQAVMRYLRKKTCPIDQLITSVYTPEKAHEALDYWGKNPGDVFRILVKF
ncbi:zinc-binding alcohol dehydrogenase family protein [Sphingobacterium sp. LRF_L2]|uniref:zinc-binding alcohol dehydrogenase family protein n=1 Tax=Sphingobacterium sp. LRF_L2 TaxID=3369421 RepID=UPI003F600B8D